MNLIVGWTVGLGELLDAIARRQIKGAWLFPNFLSSQRTWVNDKRDENDTTRAEYVLIVVVLAIVVIAAYQTFSGKLGSPL